MISGKDTAACLNLAWERLSPVSQILHEELAKQLNERHIAPMLGENAALKALVQDYQAFVTSIPFLSHERSFLKSRELLEKSFQLLSEEQKVSV